MVDREYPGRILLAEANQPPAEVVDYFGTEQAPECQMCFHFPVMPRLYYSLREEKAAPIIDVLDNTPNIPGGSQWGTFLRNHDELTLEMVTPEERAAMYGWYAPDPRMRANVGIRRRLAPLLDNSRPEIELIHALLLSLPGSPCLYYGDEIGMGDNIWLNDRDAVRTPMQWTPDRNSGFSAAEPGKLYLPVISSLVYHYNNVNVEAQMAHSSSLLHWVRAMLEVRKRHPVFGLGTFEVCPSDNDAILSYVRDPPPGRAGRRSPRDAVLCVNNLSSPSAGDARSGCPRSSRARSSIDLFGGQGFPKVSDDGHAHPDPRLAGLLLAAPGHRVRRMAEIHDATLTPTKLELLPEWMARQRWYAAKGGVPRLRKLWSWRLDDPAGEVGIETILVVDESGAAPVVYQVPLTYRGAPLEGGDQALVGADAPQRPGPALGLRRPARPGVCRPAAGAHARARRAPGGVAVRHARARRRGRPAPVVDGRRPWCGVRGC